MSAGGVLVAIAVDEGGEQRIVGWSRDGEGAFVARDCGPARAFMRLEPGLTRGL